MSKSLTKKQMEQNMTGVVDGPICEVRVLSKEEQQEYLTMVASGASMHAAASMLSIPYMAIARLKMSDENFAKELDVAINMRNGALEEILIQQATSGIDEPLTYKGQLSYEYDEEWDEDLGMMVHINKRPVTVKKIITNNASLLAVLRANNSEKWKERSEVAVNESGGPPRICNEEDREKLRQQLRERAEARLKKQDDVEDLL